MLVSCASRGARASEGGGARTPPRIPARLRKASAALQARARPSPGAVVR